MTLLYENDIGAEIIIATGNTAIPISTVLTILLEKPGGITVELAVTPTMVNFTTGVITYTTVDGDLCVAGEYRTQVHGVFADGDNIVSDMDTFIVYEKLEVT